MILRITLMNLDMNLKFWHYLFVMAFCKHPLAKISVLSPAKTVEYQDSISERHQANSDVWATMDGLKLYLE